MSNQPTNDQAFDALIEQNFDGDAIAVLAVCLDKGEAALAKFNALQELETDELPIVEEELTLDDLSNDEVGQVLETLVRPVAALGRMDFVVLVLRDDKLCVLHPMYGSLS